MLVQNLLQSVACKCYNFNPKGLSSSKSKNAILYDQSFNAFQYPTSKLTGLLAFDNDADTLAYMNALGVNVEGDGMITASHGLQVNWPDGTYGCKIIEDKLNAQPSAVCI
jgi:hypothetical protein